MPSRPDSTARGSLQSSRIKIVRAVEASEALEGYDPLAVADPEAHAIEQRFIQGDISIKEYINELVQLANG